MIRKMKGKTHYGMQDYYKFFKSQYPDLDISRSQFNKIISEFNKEYSQYLIENLEVNLPFRLGRLEMIKNKRGVYLDKNGNVINNKPINWKATKDLWESDPKMKEKKVLVRHNNTHTGGYVFKIKYNKKRAVYPNKSIYFFKPVREVSRSINKRISDYSKEKYDTYEGLKRYNYVQRKND